ncbi:MAG: adenylyltransferase/cytidyltransferase family protein [Candidatus Gracilibacteria bacterium]|nr:adenylyltransferase/cytidyltransferase family protein [Candidatus Gracilibacteria bacterium]
MTTIITGTVIQGKKLGRTIDFPTANIFLEKGNISDGVFKVNIIIADKIYHGAGCYRENIETFEIHIFEFHENIYGKNIEIIIFEKIRENMNFSSLGELKDQIKNDIITIKNLKDYVLTFGTFDLVHPGHEYYLTEAKKYGDRLVTIVATDQNVQNFKHHHADRDIHQRIEDIKNLGIADIVCPGNEDNPLIWIKQYMPKVICLGYDQNSFTDQLEIYIQKEHLDISIIRIPPFQEKQFKSSILKPQKDL